MSAPNAVPSSSQASVQSLQPDLNLHFSASSRIADLSEARLASVDGVRLPKSLKLKLVEPIVIRQFADKGWYQGGWVNGCPHGKGIYHFPDGSTYEGMWMNGSLHGKGIYKFPSGTWYEGDWIKDKQYGKGTYRYRDGSWYKGDWVNNKQHGHGIYFYQDGSWYDGEWAADKQHGKGIYVIDEKKSFLAGELD